MAEDLMKVKQRSPFHQCNVPEGHTPYRLDDLTSEQQLQLNLLKLATIREDKKYLAHHKEVRGMIVFILNRVLRAKPQHNVCRYIGEYFAKHSILDVEQEVRSYIESRDFYDWGAEYRNTLQQSFAKIPSRVKIATSIMEAVWTSVAEIIEGGLIQAKKPDLEEDSEIELAITNLMTKEEGASMWSITQSILYDMIDNIPVDVSLAPSIPQVLSPEDPEVVQRSTSLNSANTTNISQEQSLASHDPQQMDE